MKFSYLIYSLAFACTILISSCGSNSENTVESNNQTAGKSLWTDSLKNNFVNKHSESEYDKYVLNELIKEQEYQKDEKQLAEEVTAKSFNNYKYLKSTSYVVVVDDLAGKSEKQVAKILGTPDKKERVNPSGANCPCDKYTYLGNRVEIVFINKKADWITVNNNPAFTRVSNASAYQSVDRFDDYTYVKVKTK